VVVEYAVVVVGTGRVPLVIVTVEDFVVSTKTVVVATLGEFLVNGLVMLIEGKEPVVVDEVKPSFGLSGLYDDEVAFPVVVV